VKARSPDGVGPVAEVVPSSGIELGVVHPQINVVVFRSFKDQGANFAEDPLRGPCLKGPSTGHLLIGNACADEGELPRLETLDGRFVETSHLVAGLTRIERMSEFTSLSQQPEYFGAGPFLNQKAQTQALRVCADGRCIDSEIARHVFERKLAPVLADVFDGMTVDEELPLRNPEPDVGRSDLGEGVLLLIRIGILDSVSVTKVGVRDGLIPVIADPAADLGLGVEDPAMIPAGPSGLRIWNSSHTPSGNLPIPGSWPNAKVKLLRPRFWRSGLASSSAKCRNEAEREEGSARTPREVLVGPVGWG
jgi:hypothetical protein